jgi:Spy/CpxP family protein refolding chaperone
MKTKLKTVGLAFAMVLMATLNTSAYQGKGRNSNVKNEHTSCVTDIAGLTQSQISDIERMETEHQKVMEQLRTARRATTDEKAKAEVRVKMLTQRDNHRQAVKNLLTPEQKVQYDALHAYNKHQYAQNGNRNGNGNNRGNGNRGYGNQNCR